MKRQIFYILMGYLLGSVLFARVSGKLFGKGDLTQDTTDGNPGTANAFQQGGALCGALTLLGDLGKGFLPVFFYLKGAQTEDPLALSLVMAAPVIGHILPLFFRFRGGKGIATSFGVLLGLTPDIRPALCLAGTFIFFSVLVRISPHYYRTMLSFVVAALILPFIPRTPGVLAGFLLITLAVFLRLLTSKEEKKSFEVKALWMH